jgi:hypothetical protein
MCHSRQVNNSHVMCAQGMYRLAKPVCLTLLLLNQLSQTVSSIHCLPRGPCAGTHTQSGNLKSLVKATEEPSNTTCMALMCAQHGPTTCVPVVHAAALQQSLLTPLRLEQQHRSGNLLTRVCNK